VAFTYTPQETLLRGRVMTKPMGSERSVILFLLNFLLLWQIGTGTTSTTIDDSIKEVVCNGTYILPEYEGTTNTLSDSFKDISIYV
jgi:hypothetical protein